MLHARRVLSNHCRQEETVDVSKIASTLAFFGLLLLGGSAWLCVRGMTKRPGFEISDPQRILTNVQPQHDYEIAFRIRNRSGRSARLVGLGIT